MKKYYFLGIPLFTLILAGCFHVKQIATPSPQESNTSESQSVSNKFDIQNKSGDQIAGLTLVSIGAVPGIQSPFGSENIQAKFQGKITISGSYDYYFSDLFGADVACFGVTDAEEAQKLPQLSSRTDSEIAFCFTNLDKAKQEFGPQYGSGHATVVIEDYTFIYAPSEVNNEAKLVSVVSK